MSRRSSRPEKRGGRAHAERRADAEYDDYDYAPDDYQQDDDNWSPDEYFSPEGIKGRWAAGARPGERSGDHGRRDGRDSRDPRDSRDVRDSRDPRNSRGARDGRDARNGGRGYDGSNRFDGYGAPDAGPQRARGPAAGYGRDNYQQGSYGQDDSYGADDYGTGGYELPEGADNDRGDRRERSGGRRRRGDRGDRGERGDRTGAWRQRLARRDRGEDIWPDDGVSDEDYWASVAADRPLTSAAGPLDADPLQAADSRPMARPAGVGRPAGESRTGAGRLGPAPGQSGYAPGAASGPMSRPGTGPTPAWSATGPNTVRPGPAQPSFQPNGARGPGRHADRPDWTERTERIDRVTASGYPDPRASGRTSLPGPPGGPGPSGAPGVSGMPGSQRGRGDSVDRRPLDPRESIRTSGGWPSPDDDPLTSEAFSRSALTDTDGRSYRAARRSQGSAPRREAALTEETQTFSVTGQYQSDSQAQAARYPAYGGPQPGQSGPQPAQPRHAAQPQRPQLPPSDGPGGGARNPYDRGTTSSYPYPTQPYPPRAAEQDDERYSRPPRPAGYGNSGYGSYGNGSRDNGGGRY